MRTEIWEGGVMDLLEYAKSFEYFNRKMKATAEIHRYCAVEAGRER